MKIFKNSLWIDGIASDASSKIASKGLKRDFDEDSCLCLFCGFPYYDVPIGTDFDCLVNMQTQKDNFIKATLIDVTQQYAFPFDSIPTGWPVVARFMFSKEDLNFVINEIPFIDAWSKSESRFKLIAYDMSGGSVSNPVVI